MLDLGWVRVREMAVDFNPPEHEISELIAGPKNVHVPALTVPLGAEFGPGETAIHFARPNQPLPSESAIPRAATDDYPELNRTVDPVPPDPVRRDSRGREWPVPGISGAVVTGLNVGDQDAFVRGGKKSAREFVDGQVRNTVLPGSGWQVEITTALSALIAYIDGSGT